MGKKIVTSVKIDEGVWKQTKIEAISRDKQLSESLEEALSDWIRKKRR